MSAAVKPSEALRKARDLITPEGAWTQGCYARNQFGNSVNDSSRWAVCWCSIGAMHHVADRDYDLRAEMEYKLEIFMDKDVVGFNDKIGRTHAEVLDAFDRAIALAISEGC